MRSEIAAYMTDGCSGSYKGLGNKQLSKRVALEKVSFPIVVWIYGGGIALASTRPPPL
jgi:hypothetical protein